jgi:hypothetical protein
MTFVGILPVTKNTVQAWELLFSYIYRLSIQEGSLNHLQFRICRSVTVDAKEGSRGKWQTYGSFNILVLSIEVFPMSAMCTEALQYK